MSGTIENINFGITAATPGADSSDYVIFDSTTAFTAGTITAVHGINRMIFGVNNSQAGTRKAYWSADKGANWNLYDSTAVTAASAGAMSGPFDYLIDEYPDWRLIWTNGGSAQTTWRPTLTGVRGQRASGT